MRVEVRDGKLLVDRKSIALRKGLIYAALARAGWTGDEGPVSGRFFEKLLAADRRIGIDAGGEFAALKR